MKELPHEELLSGYLDGELDPSERAVVEKMLRVNADARQLLEELRTLRETIRSLPKYKLCPPLPQRSFAEEVLRRAEREMLLQPSAHTEAVVESRHESNGMEATSVEVASEATAAAVSMSNNPTAAVSSRRTAEHGGGWKRLLAAGMVLAASVALMVLSQPGDRQTTDPVVQHSPGPQLPTSLRDLDDGNANGPTPLDIDRHAEAFALSRDKLKRFGDAEGASVPTAPAPEPPSHMEQNRGSYAMPAASAANLPSAESRGKPAPAVASPLDAQATQSRQSTHDGLAARPPSPANRASSLGASSSGTSEPQDAARVRGMTTSEREAGSVTGGGGVSAEKRVAAGTSPLADPQQNLASVGNPSGQTMVVHVQVTQQGWQNGRFQEFLAARQISWRDSETRTHEYGSHKNSDLSTEVPELAGVLPPPTVGNFATPPAAEPQATKPQAPGAVPAAANGIAANAAAEDRSASRRAVKDAQGGKESLAVQNDIQLLYLDAPEEQLQALLVDLRSAADRNDSIASLTVTSPQVLERQFKAAEEQLLATSPKVHFDPAEHASTNQSLTNEPAGDQAAASAQVRNLAQMNREAQRNEADRLKNDRQDHKLTAGISSTQPPGEGKGQGTSAEKAESGNRGDKSAAAQELAKQSQQEFFGVQRGQLRASDADKIAPAESPFNSEQAQGERMELELAAEKASPAPEGMAIRLQGEVLQNFRKPQLHSDEALPADERRDFVGNGIGEGKQLGRNVEALFIIQIVPDHTDAK